MQHLFKVFKREYIEISNSNLMPGRNRAGNIIKAYGVDGVRNNEGVG